MSYNPKSLFDKIQQKEQANAAHTGNSGFGNPLLWKPKVGTTYAIRLLWFNPEEGYDREYPMINSYIHRCWDENSASGNKEHKVICPTSQYMMGETSAAFKKCPICAAMSDFYKQGQEGSESAKEIYNKFRRTCVGYVPVYIVNGPNDDESVHQIRILQYGKQFKDFFDSKIFGIKKQNRNEEVDNSVDDESIGLEAFMYYDETVDEVVTKGYNLLITTTSKKMVLGGKQIDMPQYQLDFTRKLSNITDFDGVELNTEEGVKYFNSVNSQIIHFDRDFYLKSTDQELQEFKLNYISRESVDIDTEEVETPSRPPIRPPKKEVKDEEVEVDPMDEIPMGNASKKPINKNVQPTTKTESDEIPRTASGDVDVDALLSGF